MNGAIVAVGVAAAISIIIIGLSIIRNGSQSNLLELETYLTQDGSNLEEDLKDILAFIPLDDVKRIIHSYAAYDKQINETIKFINDMRIYIAREFQKLPNIELFQRVLQQNGLKIEYWQDEIYNFWNNIPQYENRINDGSYGGLTSMIDSILNKIQKEELHLLLCTKMIESRSFRHFLLLLMSQEFSEFCRGIEESHELQRLFYWAKEVDIEIIFAVELLTHLHSYLTTQLYEDNLLHN